MKILKNATLLLLIGTPLLLMVSGCKKFLDRKPLTATFDDLHQGGLETQVFGLYSTLRGYAGFSTLPWIDFNSIRDDDAAKGSEKGDGGEVIAEFETFQYTKDDWATDTYWNDHYYMIGLTNKILFTADSLKLTDEASLRNVGEARFFRAYSFFELVKAYGPVPLLNFYSQNAADNIKPKAPVDDIYAQIDSDLNIAAQYLPLNWEVAGANRYPGRVTSGAAKSLWAQTYLQRKNWTQVVSLCQDVINSGQYSLLTDFKDIWKDGVGDYPNNGKDSKESIFEMQATVGKNGTNNYGVQWGTSQNIRQGGASGDWNLGWGWNVPTQHLVDAWDPSDPRKNKTILYSGQSDGGPAEGGYGATLPPYSPQIKPGPDSISQPYWNKKVYSDPAMRALTGQIGTCCGGADWINHRIIRYADVLLMLAEASNETGDGATAEAMLEQVRARARFSNNAVQPVLPHIAFAGQSQMRTAIKNERRWEFAMEGYRFNDLVRWGDALTVLGPLGYQPRNALYPIPQPAIDLSNGVLVQNPDY
jgi:starch-binding outer membrane protein, SusD/RagB family